MLLLGVFDFELDAFELAVGLIDFVDGATPDLLALKKSGMATGGATAALIDGRLGKGGSVSSIS